MQISQLTNLTRHRVQRDVIRQIFSKMHKSYIKVFKESKSWEFSDYLDLLTWLNWRSLSFIVNVIDVRNAFKRHHDCVWQRLNRTLLWRLFGMKTNPLLPMLLCWGDQGGSYLCLRIHPVRISNTSCVHDGSDHKFNYIWTWVL